MRRLLVLGSAVVAALLVWMLWPTASSGLVLYSAVDYGPLVARAFTKKTGIPVRVVTSTTGQLLARVSAEGKRPGWDLAWFDGAVAAAGLDQAGLLSRQKIPEALLTRKGQNLVPKNHDWIATGYTLAGVFVFRRAAKRPPMRWTRLTTASFKQSLGMNNPSISGPTYPLVAGLLRMNGGWPSGQGYFERLRQKGLKVYAKNKYTLAALKAERIQVAMVQSSAGYNLVRHDPKAYAVQIPNPAILLPRVLVEARGLSPKKREEVRRFVTFALSPKTVRMCMKRGGSDGLFWPVTKGVHVSSPLLPNSATFNLVTLNPRHWGKLEGQVNEWFSRTIAK